MSAYGSLAIVGMACRYPDADRPAQLWEMVLDQRRAFRRLPDERLAAADYYDPDPTAADKTYSLYAAVLEGWTFDRSAFRVPGRVFRAGDPAHWLALETAARALDDAGFPGGTGLTRDRVAVILGNSLTGDATRAGTLRLRWPYVRRVLAAALEDADIAGVVRDEVLRRAAAGYLAPFPPTTDESLAGALSNTIAGRICNHFDFHGGGYTVDGACASSLLAVIELCRALRDHSIDFGLAGGVDLSLDPFELVGFAKTGALATDRMRVYDERSAGFWPGEGCGMLALMRTADARAAGLRVYAEIRGWGISSDGSGGITRPDRDGQLLSLRRAYELAGLDPGEVLLHEGHGTGTQVGDEVELNALTALRENARRPAALGTVKANIGHTKAAAGAAGVIKATMSLHTGVLPPTTGCETPHPVLRSRAARLRILRNPEHWPPGPRLAGVSSMGFGGINAHLVLSGPDRAAVSSPGRAPAGMPSVADPARTSYRPEPARSPSAPDPARVATSTEPARGLPANPPRVSTGPETTGVPSERDSAPMPPASGPAGMRPVADPARTSYGPEPARSPSAPEPAEAATCADPTQVLPATNPARVPTRPEPTQVPSGLKPARVLTSSEPAKVASASDPASLSTGPDTPEVPSQRDPTPMPPASGPARVSTGPGPAPVQLPPTPGPLPVLHPAPEHAVIAVAGTDAAAMRALFERISRLAARLSFAEVHDLAAQLARRRATGPVRVAVVAASPDELAVRATAAADNLALTADAAPGGLTHLPPGVWVGHGVRGRVTLLFPGQGAPGLARVNGARAAGTEKAQPAIHRASLRGLRMLDALGVTATAAVGHSLGEITALVWSGALSVRDSIRLVRARGRLMASLAIPGTGMVSLRTEPSSALSLCAGTGLVIAAYNGPHAVVLAGPLADLREVAARAGRAGIACSVLPVSHAFHSPAVLPCVRQLRRELATVDFGLPTRRLLSTVHGRALTPDDDLTALLSEQVTAPVRFWDAVSGVLPDTDLFCACGPGQGLAALLADQGCGTPVVTVGAGDPDAATTAHAAAALFAAGAGHRIDALTADRAARPIDVWRDPTFLSSPCSAPLPFADSGPKEKETEKEAGAPEESRAPEDTATAVRDLLARATELAPELIGMETRLLTDLHLTSLTVTQLAATAAHGMGRRPPSAPLSLADARVHDLVEALDALPSAAEPGPDAVATGVDTWVHCFTERLSRARDGRLPRPSPGWRTTVLGGGEPAAYATGLFTSGAADAEHTELLYVPRGSGPPPIGPLLATARSALRTGRLVVVAHDTALSGFLHSLCKEHPGLGITLLRVPETEAGLRHAARWAGAEPGQYREVVMDGRGMPHVPMEQIARLPDTARQLPLGPGEVLLVSGGGKGIGHSCARALAQACGARLALLGRARPESDETLRTNLAALAEAGVSAAYETADLTDAAAVAEAVRRLTERLGPVAGVMHAGGINEPAPFTDLDEERVEAHVAPKVSGLRHLLAALPTGRLRLLVGFGSVIGRHGLPGESHYALANGLLRAELERLAVALPHCRVLNVDWSVWTGTGMGVRLGVLDSLLREDVTPLAPETGVDLFLRLLAAGTPHTHTVAVHGRLGRDLPVPALPGPSQRFLENLRVHYPGLELVAEARLDLRGDPYLSDHRLDGVCWLPGVLGVEAMAQAASAVAGQRLCEARDVVWAHPVTVPEEGARTVRVCALHRGDSVETVLRSDENDFCVDHFRAVFPVAVPSPNGHHAPPAVEDPLRAGELHSAELYGPLYFHTGRFQRVQRLSAPSARTCRATLAPARADPWFAAPLAAPLLGDPSANDATLHALQACVPHRRLLPVAAESLTIRPGSGPVERIRGSELSAADGEYVWDVEGLDASGRPVVQWHGLRLKDVGPLPRGDRPWPAALLAVLLERATAALGLDDTLAVAVHPGERSAVPRIPRPGLSRSHLDGLVLRVESGGGPAGPRRVACDWEAVTARPDSEWRGLLDPDRLALTELLLHRSGEPFDMAATRVWTAMECLAKAGRPPRAPLSLSGVFDGGWVLLRSGDALIASGVLRVAGVAERVAVAVLSGPEGSR
ncbi:SDR family NAD(P)-dependent oxidoreductase [Streptomyces sp. NPDC052236]|uniref:SDR family NAD(P)-dependent oxidoreductase n=1 Tax=Streptomyces sp. NPDC052236 TaxID=3365686 RepID=UPI0037D57C51